MSTVLVEHADAGNDDGSAGSVREFDSERRRSAYCFARRESNGNVLESNEEGGALLGIEIKFVPVAGGRLQAAVLVSEGEPAPMVLVDVRVDGRSISFKVPANIDDTWTFQGTISAKALKGTIKYSSGTKEEVTLPRRCGYWDR